MTDHQDMSRTLGRTQASAMKRLGLLAEQGHLFTMEGASTRAVITITRTDGTAHHIITTPGDLTPHTRRSLAYERHPQSVLMAHAIHAICDWNAEHELAKPQQRCLECNRNDSLAACYNTATRLYDWFCPTCLYGEAA